MSSPIDKSVAEKNIKVLPIMTLREVVIFPHAIMPLFVGRESSIKAIEQAISSYGKYIFLITQKEADVEVPQPDDIYRIGVVSRILQLMRLPDGSIKVLFEGLYRATWEAFSKENSHLDFAINTDINSVLTTQINTNSPHYMHGNKLENANSSNTYITNTQSIALGDDKHSEENLTKSNSAHKSDTNNALNKTEINKHDSPVDTADQSALAYSANPFGTKPYPCLVTTKIEEIDATPQDGEALYRAVHEAMEEFAKINRKISPEHVAAIAGLHHPGRLADSIMPHIRIEYPKKQEVLEILNTAERLEKTYELLTSELAVASLEKNIKGRVKSQMERNQREYYLTEQIKAIHKEMGNEDPQAEVDELEVQIKAKDMPEEAREKALRELRKLRPMSPASAEYTVSRNYIDWILDLPWNVSKIIDIDINNARQILNDAHFGLKKPKERILEYLAVQKLTDGLKCPILCLVGPPGVGKTSLAKSVAKATGREFVRMSLGGVRDEAEIRGHRRTYVGAMPGKILMALKKAKFNNPVFCLDEIDKMTSDLRGDPSSALLEVLDPEQNNTFNDHYLDLDYDLSKVFFITTANSLSSIPAPLKDRMEIVELSSYLETEKMNIAKDFLLPKQWEAHGITEKNLTITDEAMLEVIRSYTREAGVRHLEREIAALCRKTAIALVTDEHEKQGKAKRKDSATHITVNAENLNSYLGVKKYRFGERNDVTQVGVVTGLAFNSVGGDILYIETALMPGSGKIATTGQLGDVMKESAEAAFSYIRSRASLFGLKPDFYKDLDIHIHVPEGATPKDGPSAGITMATSMTSALLGIPVLNHVAMTGEITLRGRVLPIGGLREKLLAARRSNIKIVILPIDNKKDLEDVPDEILRDLNIVLVKDVDEVLPVAFGLDIKEIFKSTTDLNFLKNLRLPSEATIQQ